MTAPLTSGGVLGVAEVLAFPSVCLGDPGHPASAPGMTLRDWFAGKFLAGVAAGPNETLILPRDARQNEIDAALAEHWEHVARTAYIAADAMLSARAALRSAAEAARAGEGK